MERRSKGKGKSKSKTPTTPVNTVEQKSKSGRKKTTNTASNNNKDIVMNYPNGKVHFDLSMADPTLTRTLIHMFLREKLDLKQSSILNYLRFDKKAAQQKIYRHAIDNKQAINLFCHLFNKRKGRVSEIEQIKQLVDIVASYTIQSKDIGGGELDWEINQYNNNVDMMRKRIKTIYLGLVNQLKHDFNHVEKQLISRVKQERIKKLAIDLFQETVIAIRQKTDEEVQIIYEQSYPEKICSIAYLKSIIGEEIYNRKKLAFVSNYGKALRLGVMNTNFIVCHICKQLLLREYVRCTNNDAKEFTPIYKNSPNTYYRHILACDYCYLYEKKLTSECLGQELDYFKYFQTNNQFKCQRFFCTDCASKSVSLQKLESINQYLCLFCSLSCYCKSCVIANELIKSLAHYKKLMIENYQQLTRYNELINFVNLNDQNVKHDVVLRNTFKGPQHKDYQSIYDRMIEEFQKIATAFRRYNQLFLHSPQLYYSKARSITPYMKESLTCLNVINQFQRHVSPKTSKSLNSVRKLVDNYQNQQKHRKNHLQHRLQSDSLSRKEQKDSKCNVNGMSIKHKMQQNAKDCIVYSRYRVPLLNNIQIPCNQLTQLQEEQLNDILTQRLQKLSIADASRNIMIKTQIPYDESDYHNFINSSQSKLHTYYSRIDDQCLDKGIYHQMHDPLDGIMGLTEYKLFFDQIDEYNLSEFCQSDEQSYWQECVNKSSHQQSNYLLNQQQNYLSDKNVDQFEQKENIFIEEQKNNLSNDSRNMEQEEQNKAELFMESANQYQSVGSSYFLAEKSSSIVEVVLAQSKMEIQFPKPVLQLSKEPIGQQIIQKQLTKPKEDVMINLISSESENQMRMPFSSSSQEQSYEMDQKLKNTKELPIQHASLFQKTIIKKIGTANYIPDKDEVIEIEQERPSQKDQMQNAIARITNRLKLKNAPIYGDLGRIPTMNMPVIKRQNPFPATKESKQDNFNAKDVTWHRHPMNQPD